MKTWKEFYDDLLPQVPGCPLLMADLHLRRAAQEFCERTLTWREWLDDVTTQASTETYDFELETVQEVVQLIRANLDGYEIGVVSPDDLPSNWRTASQQQRIFTLDRRVFTLTQVPPAGLIIQTEVALKPSNTGTGVSEEVFAHYVGAIATGAAARLHAMPGKPYSQPNSVARGEFLAAIDAAASDANHAYSRTPLRVVPRFF